MLCYVGGTTRKYFKWEDNQWNEFSSGSGGGNSLIFRVDFIEDMYNIDDTNLEYGSLCHVLNDVNFRYMYYYGKDGWDSISHEYKVWIGKEPPEDKKSLWVDTRLIELDLEDPALPESSIPPSVKYLIKLIGSLNGTIVELNGKINILENELETIKKQIENGGGGGIIVPDVNMYLITEDEHIFITEDGIPMIAEEGISVPNPPPTITIDRVFLMENGDYMLTESGEYFELEAKTTTDTSPIEDSIMAIYYDETETLSLVSETLLTMEGENLIIKGDTSSVFNGNLKL